MTLGESSAGGREEGRSAGGRGAGAHRHLPGCHACAGRRPVSAGGRGDTSVETCARQRRTPSRPTCGYWFPVSGCAGTGMTTCGWGSRGRVLTAALATNSPRLSGFACGRGDLGGWGDGGRMITEGRRHGRAPLSGRRPGQAKRDPGTIGTLSRRGTGGAAVVPSSSRLPLSSSFRPSEARAGTGEARRLRVRSRAHPIGSRLSDPASALRSVRDDAGREQCGRTRGGAERGRTRGGSASPPSRLSRLRRQASSIRWGG